MQSSSKHTPGVTLRDYRLGDDASMYALDLICFEPAFRFSRRVMRNFAQASNAITILAEAGTELAGFCITHLEENTGYIVTLDVAPGFQRRGIARSLMQTVEARIRAAGGAGMALHVFPGNLPAISFYESLGYNRTSITENFYGRGIHALLYSKTW